MNNYKTIFDSRAIEYSYASEKYPKIREQEFLNILEKSGILKNNSVLDLACGDSSFAKYLKNAHYYGIDPSVNFLKKERERNVIAGSLRSLPFKNKCFDNIICLSGLHHEIYREEIYLECNRVLKDSGTFVIHDVELDSNISLFLDEFVNSFNSSGHQGNYFGKVDVIKLRNAGFRTSASSIKYEWAARNVKEMFDFMKNLFGLNKISEKEFAVEIAKYLEVSSDNYNFKVQWSLFSIKAEKNDTN
jgi:ubiquinone/menaquinone biosynthesis C-methylase UbiE